MSAAESWAIEPVGYDAHGLPLYNNDGLDDAWSSVLDKYKRRGQDMNDLEHGMFAIAYCEDIDLAGEALELIGALREREIQRRANPNLLDTESGVGRYREMVVADLRARPERYAACREAAPHWPVDPGDLDDENLEWATLIVLMPDLLRGEPWRGYIEE